MAGQELVRESVHLEGFWMAGSFGVDVFVKDPARRDVVQELDAADLDNPVATKMLGAGRFCIEDDLT
jgi:hypothetical protein